MPFQLPAVAVDALSSVSGSRFNSRKLNISN
jgi:hypothetical protein